MISIQALTFHYQRPIFENFDLQIETGETWAILGPSGCGKSTLLALLAGLKLPTGGAIQINGQRLTRPRPQTGLILQDYGLLPWATVHENVELGLKLRSFYGADGIHAPRSVIAVKETDSWLERLGLTSLAHHYPAQLSGGQRQRTAIARTLVLQPDLLLMDEPFSSLDAPTRASLQTLTLELAAEQGLTLILVTHAIEEAALLGSKILLLNEPPNRTASILPNPGAALPGHRESPAYQALCRILREKMDKDRVTATF
jgi:NitT/TauT family transport system ATP-binding protein